MFPSYFADQPTVTYAKLKYVAVESMPNIGLGSIAVRQWRANDLYDPDAAAGGHQPHGFDQIMAKYNHFTVIHSTITVEINNCAEYKSAVVNIHNSNEPGEVAAAYAAGGLNALDEMLDHSRNLNTAIEGAPAALHSISRSFDARKAFNKDIPSLCGDTNYSGNAAASPAEQSYYEIVAYSPTGLAVNFASSAIRYTIVYYAIFTEPKMLNGS